MDFYDGSTLNELGAGGDINMMIDSELHDVNNDEDTMDVGLLEKLIFSDVERSYTELNVRASKQVIKAYSKIETGKEKLRKFE
jgi:hypothetical protein